MVWMDYDEHARTRPRDDVWGQVRRTVRGQPVPAEQIGMIVAATIEHLQLGPDDVLLDIACGNGALSSCLQPHCGASQGIDISEYLIGVAQERFATGCHAFMAADAAAFAEHAPGAGRFTKALCYGSFSYLDNDAAARLLRALHRRFCNVDRILLGNLPDPARAAAFYPAGTTPDLREPRSDIGVWRTLTEIAHLAGPGWRVTRSTMPATFFAAHYRYDALLVRAS